MQNSHCQLNIKELLVKQYPWIIILLTLPFILWGSIIILPTFDDWTSLIAPTKGAFFTKERFLFYGYHWRPFDSIFGYVVGLNPKLLFPALNHICVVIGHLSCTFLVFNLLKIFQFTQTARNIATLFFFFTPGMLATVLAVDGLNQTYANFWVLLATIAYIKLYGKQKYAIWIVCVLIATLCKENGLMWSIIIPILCFGFNIIDKTTLKKDLKVSLFIILTYITAILVLPKDISIYPDYIPSVGKSITGVFKFLLSTWIAVDFVSLLHTQSRNLVIATITFLLSFPFIFKLFVSNYKLFKNKTLICMIISHAIAVAPHLGTVYSMMHTYAGLGIAALMIGYIISHANNISILRFTFILYMTAAVFIDIHLWYTSYQSGLVGRQMAKETILKTKTPAKRVKCIIIQDEYQRLSSFCVIPSDAFGWGRAVMQETNYRWPTEISDTTIERSTQSEKEATRIAKQAIAENNYDCAWIVNHQQIKVIRK